MEISRTAAKQLAKLEPAEQRRIATAIRELAHEPRPVGSRKLQGYDDVYRIRVGRFRVLYSVNDETIVAIILKVGHRRDIYR